MDITGNHQFSSSQPVDSGGSAAASLTSVPISHGSREPEPDPVGRAPATAAALHHIGYVMEIAGSGSQVTLDANVLGDLMTNSDPSIAMAGQVGSQIKIRVGSTWLLASIRTQKLHTAEHGAIMAAVDFLGEGDEERLTGKIYNFRRGVTRYPVPGSEVYAVSSADMKQVYAADSPRACRDRHGVPHQGHSRRALCRRHAGQAFRATGIDRYG